MWLAIAHVTVLAHKSVEHLIHFPRNLYKVPPTISTGAIPPEALPPLYQDWFGV